MNIVQEIKNFVKTECQKSTSKYGYEPFPYHFVAVVRYAKVLAKKQGGNIEVVLLSAWLHDIGSIIHGRQDHHLTGAKIARKKLESLDYPKEKIELIAKCILNHRGSQNNARKTIEEKIIADADALSNFDNLSGIFKAAFVYENLEQGKAQKSVLQKFENKWKKLHFESSREIIRPKYEAIRLLLR